MKKINLTRIESPDKKSVRTTRRNYQVYLRGMSFAFPSLITAQVFLKDVSARLDLIRLESNQLLKEAYSDYRSLWPYLGSSPRASGALEQCRTYLQEFDRALERSMRITGQNSHTFIFKELENCLVLSYEIYDSLEDVYRLRSMTVELYRVKIIQDRISELKKRLTGIGENHPCQVKTEGRLN